jgi:hypothetical protein
MNRYVARLIAAAAILMAPLLVLPEDPPVASRWASLPVLVDGFGEEWHADTKSSPAKTPVDLAFRNDGRNLYILFEFREPIVLSTIGSTGMALYRVAPESGERQGGTRLFVRAVAADRFVDLLERQGRRLSDRDKVEIRTKAFYPVFEALAIDGGGKVLAEPVLPAGEDPAGFKAAKKGKVVTYEIRLPISTWGLPAGVPDPRLGDAVSIEFEWGGPEFEKNDVLPNGPSPTPPGGAGFTNASGTESAGDELLNAFSLNASPYQARRKDPRFKKHTFRFDVKLAAEI